MRTTVSHSEVESYLSCARKHFFAYGLELDRKETSDALTRGKLGHSMLEIFFNSLKEQASVDEATNAAITFIASKMADDPVNSNEVLSVFNVFVNSTNMKFFSPEFVEVLAVEQEFIMPFNDILQMPFIPDLVIKNKHTGTIEVIDFKFTAKFYSARDVEFMPQLPKYIGALRALGYPVTDAGYYLFRVGSNPAFAHYPLNLTDARIQRTFTEQIQASLEIQNIKTTKSLEEWSNSAKRAFNPAICSRCQFFDLCRDELNDDSPQMTLDAKYKKKERREFNGTK